MAFFAAYDGVLPVQGKARHIMIKINMVRPALLIVTGLTVPAFLPPVHVIHPVATQTVCFQLVFMHIALMACTAL